MATEPNDTAGTTSVQTLEPEAEMTTAAPPTRRRRGYWSLWRTVVPELGYLLPILPILIAGMVITSTLFFAGVGMIAIVIGVFLVLAALYCARGFGMFELLRLRAAGRPEITAPPWDRVAPRSSFWGKLLAPAIDGHYWLHFLHTFLVFPLVGTLTWSIAFSWLVGALSGVTYWFWQRWAQEGDREWNFLQVVADWLTPGGAAEVTLDSRTADSIFFLIVGLVLLFTLPLVTRALTLAHWGIARGMLGDFRSERLAQQVAGLSASRSAVVAAEGTALRRLERDIHDGPQQRLVRLQMDIAAADRQLEADPAKARQLLSEAMQQSRDALDELRALSRGFAPPILLDRGLVAALDALATRSTRPVRFTSIVPDDLEIPVELERNAYFIAAEAVTNAVKHAEASAIELKVEVRHIPAAESASRADETWLDVVVADDGRGGAITVAGHGLDGLAERARGVGGVLDVRSPIGGPTVVIAHLPVGPAFPAA